MDEVASEFEKLCAQDRRNDSLPEMTVPQVGSRILPPIQSGNGPPVIDLEAAGLLTMPARGDLGGTGALRSSVPGSSGRTTKSWQDSL
jgi:hypothetical protein